MMTMMERVSLSWSNPMHKTWVFDVIAPTSKLLSIDRYNTLTSTFGLFVEWW